MENRERKIQELLRIADKDAIDEKMQYLIFRLASESKLSEFDISILNEINSFFDNIGDEGTDFERYLDFAKINILMNNNDFAKNLIAEMEKELEKNFLLPNGDVFSIYRDVAILEAM